MTNVSVKVKRKTSAIPGKRMPLFLQIIYNRVVKRVVLDLKLTEQEWIETTQTILIPPDAGNERIKALMLIKEALERNLAEMEEIVQHLKDTKECSAERIVHDFRNRKCYTLWLEYIQLVIEKKRGQRSGTTIRNYQNTHKTFRDFLQGEDIPIKDVDEDLIISFEKYLTDRKLSKNTIAFHCRNLKAVWNFAVREQVIEQRPSPFRNINTKIDKTEKRAITEKYLHKLEALNLENAPGLSLARDLFLFSFFVRGMAFVDLAHLTLANIHGNKLIYVRRKTGQVLKVELLPVMLKIIRKYHQPGQPYLFPVLKNADASWKEYDSALRLQNKRLNILGNQIGTHLSTYVARHSWASIAKLKGVTEEVISDCMGHTSVNTTRIYIASLDNSKLDRANRKVIVGNGHAESYFEKRML